MNYTTNIQKTDSIKGKADSLKKTKLINPWLIYQMTTKTDTRRNRKPE